MKSTGFKDIIDILSKYNPSLMSTLPDLRQYPGACSYCNSVFSNKELTQKIRTVFAEYETDTLIAAHDELITLLGEENFAQLFKQFTHSANQEN